MDFGTLIEQNRQRTDRMADVIYPRQRIRSGKERATTSLLGTSIMAAIPALLGAKGVARTIFGAGALGSANIYARAQAQEEERRKLFDHILGNLVVTQTQAYLQQEQDASRAQRWKGFLSDLATTMKTSGAKADPMKLSTLLLGAALKNGLDPGQIQLFTKTLGLASRLTQKAETSPRAKQLIFKSLTPGSALVGIDPATGKIISQAYNPKTEQPEDESKNDYRQAQAARALAYARKLAAEEGIQYLANTPIYQDHISAVFGGKVYWKADTPPEIKQKFVQDLSTYIEKQVGGGGHPQQNPNPSTTSFYDNPSNTPPSPNLPPEGGGNIPNPLEDPLAKAFGLTGNEEEIPTRPTEPENKGEQQDKIEKFLHWITGTLDEEE